jgi:hypothetical protein
MKKIEPASKSAVSPALAGKLMIVYHCWKSPCKKNSLNFQILTHFSRNCIPNTQSALPAACLPPIVQTITELDKPKPESRPDHQQIVFAS